MKFLLLVLALTAVSTVCARQKRTDWVLLISGSNGYEDYRHQADICHAYQIFHAAGIPDENIIVMMYDDIAFSPNNPLQGKIFNSPFGPNVYAGVPKDYTHNEVNVKTFLAALTGDKEAVKNLLGREGKVIDSGPDDHIFVYFSSHGAPGYLVMPSYPFLAARELNRVLRNMYQNKRFAQLIFYLEACNAGSMFDNLLPKDINVYATTASDPYESSYAIYYSPFLEAFLGDQYSVIWMDDTELADLSQETFQQQYNTVKRATTRSHVMQYGNTSIAEMTLNMFFTPAPKKHRPKTHNPTQISDATPSEMVRIQILKNKISTSPINSFQRQSLERELQQLYEDIDQTNKLFKKIAVTVYSGFLERQVDDLVFKQRGPINNWDCYETAFSTLTAFCPKLYLNQNEFALRQVYSLVNLCNGQAEESVISAIETAAASSPLCIE